MAQRERFAQKKKPKDTRGTLLRIIRYLSDYLWIVILLAALSFLSNLGNLMGPRFAGKAIDIAEEGFKLGVGKVDMDAVIHYAILMAVFYVGSNILNFLVSIGMMRVGRRVAQTMRQDVFHKLMRLPVSFFDRNQAADPFRIFVRRKSGINDHLIHRNILCHKKPERAGAADARSVYRVKMSDPFFPQ